MPAHSTKCTHLSEVIKSTSIQIVIRQHSLKLARLVTSLKHAIQKKSVLSINTKKSQHIWVDEV